MPRGITRFHAFIDEFGNSDLNILSKGCTSHFIITAIIVDESNLIDLENEIEKIRQNNFQTGPIKSRTIGSNDDKRIKLLRDLAIIEFSVLAFIVNKKNIVSEGLKFKQSFYKFLNSKVHDELIGTYPLLQITADNYGSPEFMAGFKDYVQKKHSLDLFNYNDFGFASSRSDLLIQLADFIGGTIARAFDDTVLSSRGNEFIQILSDRMRVVEWPKITKHFEFNGMATEEENAFATAIGNAAIQSAEVYLDSNNDSNDPLSSLRRDCIKFLLFQFRYIGALKYASSHEIRRNISIGYKKLVSENSFRIGLIGHLRDSGVLISSSPHGYKLPCRIEDCQDFINKSSSTIIPMLKRINIFKNKVRMATNGQINILNKKGYELLAKILEIEGWNL